MGRPSVAGRLLDEAQSEPDRESGWLILYDFEGKPSRRFWWNLREIQSRAGVQRIQYSALSSKSSRAARVAGRLVEYYGGEALLFEVTPAHE